FFLFSVSAISPIYTLSLHDALPISSRGRAQAARRGALVRPASSDLADGRADERCERAGQVESDGHAGPLQHRDQRVHHFRLVPRSEEHTSELQSGFELVCRLLLEKK